MRDDLYNNQVVEPTQALPPDGDLSADHASTSALTSGHSDAPAFEAAANPLSAGRETAAEGAPVEAAASAPEAAPSADAFAPVSSGPESQDAENQPPAAAQASPDDAAMEPDDAATDEAAGGEPDDAPSPAPLLNLPTFRPLWTVTPSRSLPIARSSADEAGVIVSAFAGATPGWKHWLREGLSVGRDVLLALVIALLIGLFVIQPVYVKGTSMLPRLREGERLFVNRFIYNFSKIERGDIVVFYYPKNPQESFIKRVIGLPGDEVLLSGGKLYINGKLIPETYLSSDYTTIVSPPRTWVVEPHHYFVMGDNRDASNDSRNWGLVPEMYIYGKAVYRYWPVSEMGFIGDEAAALEPLRSPRRLEPQRELPPAE